MNILNLKIINGITTIIMLSFIVTACGGKPDSYSGDTKGSVTVPGTQPPPANINAPIIDISAASTSISYNTSTTITWSSTRSTSCTSSPIGLSGVSGSYTTPNLTSTTTYILTCSGTGGTSIGSVKIAVSPSVITAFSDAGSGNVTVTSANTLSNGAIITISGTTNYNGTYTVSNVTPTSFRIVHAFNVNDATGVWQMAGGMISGCSTTGATGVIALSQVPSRFNGVAPLSVFFDSADTTATSTTPRPFHDLEYRWNFGDSAGSPVSGTTWSTGSRPGVSSRNTTTGPVAAHVYETPGIYTVTLAATDGTSTVTNSCAQIVVQDPDVVFAGINTTCVGASSVPVPGSGGCPVGANAAQQSSFPAAISSYALTGKRVLFKRGDTFMAATSARITATGPGTVGSYGSGALPVIQMTGNTNTLGFSSQSTPTFSDWRIMDMEFNGNGSAASTGVGLDGSSGGVRQVTIFRNTFRSYATSIGFGSEIANWWNNSGSSGHTVDQLAIVDNTSISGTNTGITAYNAGNRVSFMGNSLDNGGVSTGSHVTRFPYLGKAVIGNNNISRPGGDRHTIKLHAPFWIGGVPDVGDRSNYSLALNGDGYTKQVIISDNKFTDFRDPWSISIGPQDAIDDARLRDIILERNLHIATPTTQAAQVIRAQEVTSRNNLFLGGGGSVQTGVLINVDGGELPASNVRVYNNTQYSADAVPSSQFVMVDISDARVSNITIKNNLAYAPKAKNPLLYINAGAKNVVVSNNSTNSQIKNMSPLFTATPPVQIMDWIPQARSYSVNAGASVPVWSDFFGNIRPINGMTDIGAVELP